MERSNSIRLRSGFDLPVLYEDSGAVVIDKPAGWFLGTERGGTGDRDLQAALVDAIRSRESTFRSRGIKFLRFVHRLDSATTGALLLAKSPGALRAFSELFRRRAVRKAYLAVVDGAVHRREWTCDLPLAPDPEVPGKVIVSPSQGQVSVTHFRLIATSRDSALILATPITGRTHQIRVHLAHSATPVVGDPLYAARESAQRRGSYPMALRGVGMSYQDPFRKTPVRVIAPVEAFLAAFGFAGIEVELRGAIRDVCACQRKP